MKTNQARRPPSLMSKIVTLIQKIVPNSKQRITASTSDDESSFLPEDMVLNILIKLPVKTLLRFECLSKGIKTLVESPYFVAAHAEHQGTNRTGIFLLARQINGNNRYNYNAKNNTSSVSCFSCPFLENPRLLRGLKYVGSWNGLVCLNVFVNRSSESNMVLWNPATSDFCFAPPPLIVPSDSGNDSVYGFGYDSVTDDYKSIRFIKPVSGPTKTVEVLSWRKRSWTKLEPERCLDEPFMGFDHVTSKGRANWMVKSSGMLLSFKLSEEKFELISPPPKDYNDGSFQTRCVWKGSLAMLVERVSYSSLTLWLFDDDGSRDRSCCWSKLFTFRIGSMVSLPEDIVRTVRNEGWNFFVIHQYDDRFALASMTDMLMPQPGYYIKSAFEFAETLVPIPGSSI